MSEHTKCQDCGFTRVGGDTQAEDMPNRCWVDYASNMVAIPRCRAMTITRLRSELELARAVCEAADSALLHIEMLSKSGLRARSDSLHVRLLHAAVAAYKAHQGASK